MRLTGLGYLWFISLSSIAVRQLKVDFLLKQDDNKDYSRKMCMS